MGETLKDARLPLKKVERLNGVDMPKMKLFDNHLSFQFMVERQRRLSLGARAEHRENLVTLVNQRCVLERVSKIRHNLQKSRSLESNCPKQEHKLHSIYVTILMNEASKVNSNSHQKLTSKFRRERSESFETSV